MAKKKKSKLDQILDKLTEHDGRFYDHDLKLDRMATKDDLGGLRKEIMGGQDKVMDELIKAREDRTLAVGKDREQDRRLGDLENRVQKVEARVG